MLPLMSKGDILHLLAVPHNRLRVGDAVFCRIKGGLQVHKITAIQKDQWQISNNKNFVNGWISAKSIFGLCVAVNDKVLVSSKELNERE